MKALYRLGGRIMRRLPGPLALRLSRDWRIQAWLADAEVVLVSFPKSGRTFVRAMLARLYQLEYGLDERGLLHFPLLLRAPAKVPRLLFSHDGDAMRSPSAISVKRSDYAGRRVALIGRHPGDIAVSRYHHLKHRSRDPARKRLAEQPVEEFVWTESGGIPSIVTFLNEWARFARERGDIPVFRYEDFRDDPQPTLQALAKFVGLSSDESAVREAVEFTRFESLQQKEREGYYEARRLQAREAGNENSFKVRSGKSGGFRKELSEAGVARVEAYIAEHLDPVFGYASAQQSSRG